MRSLMRRDPFGEMRPFRRRWGRLFDDFFPTVSLVPWESSELAFPVDLYEGDDKLVAKATLPGVKPEDVDISITGDVLTIKGETKAEEETKGETYHRREIRHGAFSRSIPLPTKIDFDKTEAVFEEGILTVTMPKADEVKPKTIKVKADRVVEGKS